MFGISGLGAAHRVFGYLNLDCEILPIKWLQPKTNEPIEGYAKRLSSVINKEEVYGHIGVSFGGLIAVDMSKILNPVLTILISSAETKKELLCIYRCAGKTGITKILQSKILNPQRKIAYYIFGTEKRVLLNKILDDTNLNFAK